MARHLNKFPIYYPFILLLTSIGGRILAEILFAL